jgi:hypothetical protein
MTAFYERRFSGLLSDRTRFLVNCLGEPAKLQVFFPPGNDLYALGASPASSDVLPNTVQALGAKRE